MEKTNSYNEMVSLNSEFSEFDLQKLEERLETDPLAIGGLLDISSSSMNVDAYSSCNEFGCSYYF